jgi:hypothetical protein
MLRANSHRYYRGKYLIVFYDSDDDTLLHEFDNIISILDFKGLTHTPQNIKTMQCNIMRALKWYEHKTRCLTGKLNYVYLVDMVEED